jgi:hypothetical protein
MVSSITKLLLIGAGLAIAAGLAYFTYQNLSSDTLSGQLARSRLGLDELPPTLSLLYYNTTGQHRSPTASTVKDPTPYNMSSYYAAYYLWNDLSSEEERYEQPWALR